MWNVLFIWMVSSKTCWLEDIDCFFNFITTSHPNISFNMEKWIDNKLPFLNILFGSYEKPHAKT